ncbi:3-phosphoshikimate 1-carboxyvinyltransferase [hydrothermal vent metagenome]|uniref:3-phosphoshikimate 1-carboxyvinyltransferase n=1 Tax=hydrothermal vent metagenome TaxID=652676 RepID=A0A3B0T867_9ZZZZ
MKYQLSAPINKIESSIKLPSSKSISNRVLIINSLSNSFSPARNLSDSDDTKIMERVLNSNSSKFDIGHAGTAMRFLTAFLSKIAGQWEITGSQRMKQRPIGILVDTLRKLGAKIEYIENEGYPPLRIWGSHLKGGVIELDGSVSSQYITALLLIAPTLEGGLTLKLKNKITSRSYIELTLKLMAKFGIRHSWEGNEIRVEEQDYLPVDFSVEADWSGASYWYQIAALCDEAEIQLENLELPSIQGDAAIAKWFEAFGVISKKSENGILLIKKGGQQPQHLSLNFTDNPDMAQTMAVLNVAKKVPFHFSGLETLKIKETNRIAALQNELAKFGATLTEPSHGELAWDGTINESGIQKNPVIDTYNDHRMAMAFAPMALAGYSLQIAEPLVVTKSYTKYWYDLQQVGFSIKET